MKQHNVEGSSVLCIGVRHRDEVLYFRDAGYDKVDGIDLFSNDYIIECDMSKMYESKKAAVGYDTARALPEHATLLLTNILREYTPVDNITSVLDIGGGTGRFSPLLQNLYQCPVYTFDPSVEMLKQGASRNLNDIHWLASNAEYIPLKSDSIDLVWMSQVYHHLENRQLAFHEISRVLTMFKVPCKKSMVMLTL